MDCDGLKKDLITDTDGTLFGQPSSVFSQDEYYWGNLIFHRKFCVLMFFLKVINNMVLVIFVFQQPQWLTVMVHK
jgi:hypothetical protein